MIQERQTYHWKAFFEWEKMAQTWQDDQEWPEDFEEFLKTTSLPTADLSADLATQVDIVCGLLDIPRYK